MVHWGCYVLIYEHDGHGCVSMRRDGHNEHGWRLERILYASVRSRSQRVLTVLRNEERGREGPGPIRIRGANAKETAQQIDSETRSPGSLDTEAA